jgi:uncharacterized membrane protein
MSWILRYRCKVFLRCSLWAAPVASMAAAILLAPLIRLIDDRMQWTLMGFGLDGSRAVIGALASSLLTFIVFAFSIILLAVQVSGAQLSPLVIGRIFESRLVKLVLSAFVFSYAYTLAALGRIEERVPQLPVLIAVLSSLVSIALFLYLIQTASQSLRQGAVLTRVAFETRAVIHDIYPSPFAVRQGVPSGPDLKSMPAQKTIVHEGRPGAVRAFDAAGLVEIARRAGFVIELVPGVGDFLAPGEEVFRLYGAGTGTVNIARLRDCVALGSGRALENDPAFGFRILVDIAIKALSPAINDPTTGVQAIDQIHHLLHLLGKRNLDPGAVRDSSGELRLVYRTPCWEDFITLAVTEIRLCGAGSPQVTRRLQTMFEQLMQVVPAERALALRQESGLLQRTIERAYPDPEDRIIAGVGDLQGFGSRKISPERYFAR